MDRTTHSSIMVAYADAFGAMSGTPHSGVVLVQYGLVWTSLFIVLRLLVFDKRSAVFSNVLVSVIHAFVAAFLASRATNWRHPFQGIGQPTTDEQVTMQQDDAWSFCFICFGFFSPIIQQRHSFFLPRHPLMISCVLWTRAVSGPVDLLGILHI
jgi:hypothetical protein